MIKYRKNVAAIALLLVLSVVLVRHSHHVKHIASIVDNRPRVARLHEEPKWDGPEEVAHSNAVKKQIEAEFLNPLARHRKLTVAKQLLSCSVPNVAPGAANVLTNVANLEGVMSRVVFSRSDAVPDDVTRFNPNILPYPPGSQYPYIGFVRESLKSTDASITVRHFILSCDLGWESVDTFGNTVLKCQTAPKRLEIESWPSPTGSCVKWPNIEAGIGHIDARVFFSPLGEPLMIVGSNGRANCVHQYVVDLRRYVPDLAPRMRLEQVPVRFPNMTYLARQAPLAEMEKNYLMLFDDKNNAFVHHDLGDRSLALLSDPQHRNLAVYAPTPECVLALRRTLPDPDRQKMKIHQATNSLRVTLCDYPCEPTAANTVLVAIMHVKYENWLRVYYRRYLVVMNATAPFHILARSNNLVYAGTDERQVVYTVSMQWDHAHFRNHADVPLHYQESNLADDERKKLASDRPRVSPRDNDLVNDYYHGWLDDTILIGLGINDLESGVTHVSARKLLDCLVVCR